MVNISKVDDSTIKFTFTDNDRYLYNGEISLPLNSLILELDASDMVIFKKIDGDVFVTFLISNSNFDTKEDLEEFYATSMVGSTGGGGGITSGEVQTMIDDSISGKQDTLSAGTGIDISGNVISATGGGGGTYSAGTGIEIDSANTITAVYSGYPSVSEERSQIWSTTDPVYVFKANDCQEYDERIFNVNTSNMGSIQITLDFANHTYTANTQGWESAFTLTWDDMYDMFLVTPLEEVSVMDQQCIRFDYASGVTIAGSGTTTSVITDVMNKANASVNNMWLSTSKNNLSLYYAKNGSNNSQGAYVNIGGGLYGNTSNSTLTTRVIKSLDKIWADYPEFWEGRWYVEFDNVEAVSFDLTATPMVAITVSTTNYSMETIVNYDGSIASGQSGVSVTEDNGHIVVTAIDGLINQLGAQTHMGNYMANLKQYGYEYTTVDDAIETILSGKQDTLSAGTGIEISGNVISATGGGGGIDSGTVQTMIDDSISGKADTSAVTESINAAVSGKVDTSAITSSVTSASTDSEVPTAKAVFDAIPTGGGKTISAGTNISVTTGETADTVSCTIPFNTAGLQYGFNLGTNLQNPITLSNRILIGKYISSTQNSMASNSIGLAVGDSSHKSQIYGSGCVGIGYGWKIGANMYDNPSNCVAIGNAASAMINDSIAIGHNAVASGTTKTNINEQLKIDTSNQVYIYNKDNTEMICLQDQLGGGGGTVSSAITSGDTNAVAGGAVYDKFDEVEQVTAAALNNLSAAFDGLKLKKLTQAQYDALSPNYDNNTLYVII